MPQSAIQSDAISEAYAKALFGLALEKGALADVAEELDALAEMVDTNKDLSAWFAHPTIDRDDRAASIAKVFSGRMHAVTLNFLLLLNRKGRLTKLRGIREAFDRLAKDKRGEIDVQVDSARPLGTSQLDRVAASVSKLLGKKAVLHPRIDAKLIGGLRLRIGDRLIDASVAARLRKLARKIDTTGHDAVRAAAEKILVS